MKTLSTTRPRSTPSTGKKRPDGPFRIATVAELTGVAEPTLRAWERRYGIPSPERTSSGYRLYGAGEVAQVLEMKRLCEEDGLAAAEAAAVVLAKKAPAEESAEPASADPWGLASHAILQTIRRFDDVGLDEELRKLVFMGPGTVILDRVLTPVLVEVGTLWHAGKLSIAQEHFASERIGSLLRDLARLGHGDASERVICACFADEEHEIGMLGAALRFTALGYRPLVLGARTPPSAVREAVVAKSPVMVALSVTLTPARGRARELLVEYASACADVPFLVGGAGAHAIEDLVVEVGGTVVAADSDALRDRVRKKLGRRPGLPVGKR